MKKKLSGKSIVSLGTIDSWYSHGNLRAYTRNDVEYRINSGELQRMLKYFDFEMEKARVYTYLGNPKLKVKK